jgi:RPA family protein
MSTEGVDMRLEEIMLMREADAAEQRVKRLKANAKSAKERAKQLKVQAETSAEQLSMQQSRAKLAQLHRATVSKPIKPYH